jgi:hypothetical protein
MIQPKAFGRLIPHSDSEVDDHTPGANGAYVTCGDTSAGRAVAWATNGRVDKDGSVYRAVTKDPGAATLDVLALEIKAVAGLTLIQPTGWAWGECSFHLMTGTGLIIQGLYSSIPAQFRFQDAADFTHDMFACYRSLRSGVRLYDPLNPDTAGYGRWVPAPIVRAFIESGGAHNITVGYLVNQPVGGTT